MRVFSAFTVSMLYSFSFSVCFLAGCEQLQVPNKSSTLKKAAEAPDESSGEADTLADIEYSEEAPNQDFSTARALANSSTATAAKPAPFNPIVAEVVFNRLANLPAAQRPTVKEVADRLIAAGIDRVQVNLGRMRDDKNTYLFVQEFLRYLKNTPSLKAYLSLKKLVIECKLPATTGRTITDKCGNKVPEQPAERGYCCEKGDFFCGKEGLLNLNNLIAELNATKGQEVVRSIVLDDYTADADYKYGVVKNSLKSYSGNWLAVVYSQRKGSNTDIAAEIAAKNSLYGIKPQGYVDYIKDGLTGTQYCPTATNPGPFPMENRDYSTVTKTKAFANPQGAFVMAGFHAFTRSTIVASRKQVQGFLAQAVGLKVRGYSFFILDWGKDKNADWFNGYGFDPAVHPSHFDTTVPAFAKMPH